MSTLPYIHNKYSFSTKSSTKNEHTKQSQGVFDEVFPCFCSTDYFNFTLTCYLKWSSKNASFSYRGGGVGWGGEGGCPYLTDAGDALVVSRDRETTFAKLKQDHSLYLPACLCTIQVRNRSFREVKVKIEICARSKHKLLRNAIRLY